jgi:hypothetical protein
MHSNYNMERTSRNKTRNATPPGDVEIEAKKQQAKKTKQWSRENNKRDQWQSYGAGDF